MDDDETEKNLETNLFGKRISKVSDARDVLQPLRFRCSPIISYFSDRKYILRQLNFVLYFGTILWIVLFISKVI
jgi:hypothetical protein